MLKNSEVELPNFLTGIKVQYYVSSFEKFKRYYRIVEKII